MTGEVPGGLPPDAAAVIRDALDTERQETLDRLTALRREFEGIVESSAGVATDDEHDPEGATIAFERAQLAALLNRHALETPLRWRDPGAYYGADPCNRYAWFWHRHGVGRRAYGFAYDDVNDQSSSLAVPDPLEIRISWRLD